MALMNDPGDDRSPLAVAMGLAAEWSSRIMTIAAIMVLPALAGHWLDGRLAISPVFVALGSALGLFAGIYLLKRFSDTLHQGDSSSGDEEQPDGKR